MAVAMIYPETQQGRKGASKVSVEVGFSAQRLSQARTVLRALPETAKAVLAGTVKLDAAYEEAKRELNVADPVAFIVSTNIRRRHMTKGQPAMAVAMLCPEPAALKRKGSGSLDPKELGYSVALISQARTVPKWAPELAASVTQVFGDLPHRRWPAGFPLAECALFPRQADVFSPWFALPRVSEAPRRREAVSQSLRESSRHRM